MNRGGRRWPRFRRAKCTGASVDQSDDGGYGLCGGEPLKAAPSLGSIDPGAAGAPHLGPQLTDGGDLLGAIEERH